MKKALSLLLAIVLIISIVPLSAITACAETYSGTCGDNLTWSIDTKTEVLKISGTGDMYDFSSDFSSPWEDFELFFDRIEIENGVTSIGDEAFEFCGMFLTITIPNSVKSIGDYAFAQCSNLRELTIPTGVISIGNYAFDNCYNLSSITLSDTVENIGDGAFLHCRSIKSFTIPSSVKSIGYLAFCGSYSLNNIEVDVNNTHFTSIDGVLFDKQINTLICYPPKKEGNNYIIPATTVKVADCAFYCVEQLVSVSLPKSVTSIGDEAFYCCNSLKFVTITKHVINIGDCAFLGCEDFLTLKVDEGSYAYNYAKEYALKTYLTKTLTPDAPSIKSHSSTSLELNAIDGCEYSNDGINWQSNTIFDGLTPLKKYSFYQRVAESENNVKSDTSVPLTVIIPPEKPVLANKTDTMVTLTKGENLEYSKNGADWQDSNIFENLTANTSYTFYQRSKTNETVDYNLYSEGLTVTTHKHTTAKPLPPTVASKTDTSITLTPNSAYEYSKNGVDWQDSNIFDNLESKKTYTFYWRIKETDTSYASPVSDALKVTTSGYISISYNANGGTNAPRSITVLNVQANISDVIPVRENYKFIGWCSLEDSSKIYKSGERYTKDEDIELYAVWLPICSNCDGSGESQVASDCSYCSGIGKIYWSNPAKCRNCESTNIYTYISYGIETRVCRDCTSTNVAPSTSGSNSCSSCSGSGKTYILKSCSSCNGFGCYINTPKIESFNFSQVILLKIAGYEYSKDGINWQSSNVFNGLEYATTYTFYQRVSTTQGAPFNVKSKGITQKTTKGPNPNIAPSPKLHSKTSSSITLVSVDGCEYSNNGIDWQSSPVFSGLLCDTEYTFYLRFTETDKYSTGEISNPLKVSTVNGPTDQGTCGENLTWKYYNKTGLLKIEGTGDMTSIPWSDYSHLIKSVSLPNDLTFIYPKAFYDSKITSITIPNSVTSIGDSAFKYCDNLKYITIPFVGEHYNGVENTNFSYIFGGRYYVPTSLKTVTITGGNRIRSYAFEGLTQIETIVISSGVKTIESYAFEDCTNLTSITIPSSVTNMEYNIFNGCDLVVIKGCPGTRAADYADSYSIEFKGSHKYSDTCDTTCNECGAKRSIAHKYATKIVKKATMSANGSTQKYCTVCGKKLTAVTVRKISSVKLSTTSYTYNGKVKTPTVTVKNSAGTTLKRNTDYTVKYSTSRKNVGKYKVTVTFKGKYSGTKTLYFKINPAKTTVKSLTAGKKSLKVAITKKSTQVTGYQIQYSTSKTFKSAKSKTLSSYKTTSTTLSKLSAKRTYYVRVRTYKTVKGVKYYSGWSTYKYKKTK